MARLRLWLRIGELGLRCPDTAPRFASGSSLKWTYTTPAQTHAGSQPAPSTQPWPHQRRSPISKTRPSDDAWSAALQLSNAGPPSGRGTLEPELQNVRTGDLGRWNWIRNWGIRTGTGELGNGGSALCVCSHPTGPSHRVYFPARLPAPPPSSAPSKPLPNPLSRPRCATNRRRARYCLHPQPAARTEGRACGCGGDRDLAFGFFPRTAGCWLLAALVSPPAIPHLLPHLLWNSLPATHLSLARAPCSRCADHALRLYPRTSRATPSSRTEEQKPAWELHRV